MWQRARQNRGGIATGYHARSMTIDRRAFMGAGALGLIGMIPGGAEAQALGESSPPAAPADVTRLLAAYVVQARPDDLPANVRAEACRTLLNWVGCAVGGAQHETVDIAVRALRPFSGPPQASLLGRRERVDILHAALMNGISSHVFDFDDTHLKTVIHPGRSGRLRAFSRWRRRGRCPGATSCTRWSSASKSSAASATPSTRRTTIAAGTSPARPACSAPRRRAGELLGLSEQQMRWALGLAATQPVGLREMFGTMTKSFHPGRAAQNGLTAALLAKRRLHQQRGRASKGKTRLGARAEHRRATTRDHARASASATRSCSTPTSRSPAAS